MRLLPETLQPLHELAFDLRWSWNHHADNLWSMVDQSTWEATGNPWLVLQGISQSRLESLAQDARFLGELERVVGDRRRYHDRTSWFEQNHAGELDAGAAYFSMEFGATQALPIYAGGLGILAADFLKAASDLRVPLTGVGLLYQQGYFRQVIDAQGEQREAFPYNEPATLPISPVYAQSGEWEIVEIALPGRTLRVRAWEAQIGRVTLYLLDTNHPLNHAPDRAITAELYGGDRETRLQQEIVLGIGGSRLLERLKVPAAVCHLNEGHAAFAVLERARAFAARSGRSFFEALRCTRAGNVFTTHTPVASGFDAFEPSLFEQYFAEYARSAGVEMTELLALGRAPSADAGTPFSMAYLAANGCSAINGVSALHEKASKQIFQPLFPRRPQYEVPVGHVTNGVHVPSWDGIASDELWTRAAGKERWLGDQRDLERRLEQAGDVELWEMRGRMRAGLAEKLPEIAESRFAPDPNVLTIGLARRFTAYKRVTLLLEDPERLARILNDSSRPVQLLVAGKAHPRDLEGRLAVRRWVEFARRAEVAGRVCFLPDYDLALAAALTQGVDLWINTPLRPWEACGTSGMKTLVNGALNLSSLDGWWDEAYAPECGWALEGGAAELYALLEREVIPSFYDRDARGIPTAWVAKMRVSLSRLTPRFSANRMVREYVESYYLSAARAWTERTSGGGEGGAKIENWARQLQALWSEIHIGAVSFRQEGAQYGAGAHVYLGDIDAESVEVQIYADSESGAPFVRRMERISTLPGSVGSYVYAADGLPGNRPQNDFTVRVVPAHPAAAVPLECNLIAWQMR